MAPKKSKASKPSPTTITTNIADLRKDCNIPNSVQVRHIIEAEERRWRFEGLGKDLLVLDKKHIETIRLPIHPLVLQCLSTLQVHPMQLIPNSVKFIVAFAILDEAEGKNISLCDLLYAFRFKTLTNPNILPKGYNTFYLSSNNPSSKKVFMFTSKLAVDKDWETTGGLFFINGEGIPSSLNCEAFPLPHIFARSKFDLCSTLLS